jgi:hypothetical protein
VTTSAALARLADPAAALAAARALVPAPAFTMHASVTGALAQARRHSLVSRRVREHRRAPWAA